MAMSRREFLHTLAVATASGFPFAGSARAAAAISGFYDLHQFGNNVTLLHFTDCHAQLLPSYFREPSVNLGVGDMAGRPPHLVGAALLKPVSRDLVHAAFVRANLLAYAMLGIVPVARFAKSLVVNGRIIW